MQSQILSTWNKAMESYNRLTQQKLEGVELRKSHKMQFCLQWDGYIAGRGREEKRNSINATQPPMVCLSFSHFIGLREKNSWVSNDFLLST